MKFIAGVEIIRLESKTPNDPRGHVFEWKGITDAQIVQISSYVRKKGTVAGNHFHKGDDPSKNPEIFMLVSGKGKLWAYNKRTKEEKEVEIGPGTVIKFWPNVLHKITSLTDVAYIEPRITPFDPKRPDTYPKEEY